MPPVGEHAFFTRKRCALLCPGRDCGQDKDSTKLQKALQTAKDAWKTHVERLGARPAPDWPPSISKDLAERVLQHMVIQGPFDEVSVENASGFNADYLQVRSNAPLLGLHPAPI